MARAQNINSDNPSLMKVIQSPLFERKVKKFKKNQKLSLDEQEEGLIKKKAFKKVKVEFFSLLVYIRL
jgi:hypothetical protein